MPTDTFPPAELDRPLTYRFRDQVSRFPDHLAVQDHFARLTYAELDLRANQIAQVILERLGEGNEPIALLMNQDTNLIATVLGVLKAGKLFVPLDPRYPLSRNVAIANDAAARLLITVEINLPLAMQIGTDRTVLNVPDIPSSLAARTPDIASTPKSLAGLYYTSGSTGAPKGVMMDHKMLMHYTLVYSNAIGIQPEDRISLLSPFTYAAALADIFGALLNGAALLLFDFQTEGVNPIAQWMADERISVFRSTSTLFRSLCSTLPKLGSLPAVRVVRLGGERVSVGDVEMYKKGFSELCILYIVFASTEALIMTDLKLDKSSVLKGRLAPAGRPVVGKRLSIIDGAGNPARVDEAGEIVVQSRYLSPGYWRQPELTRALFISSGDDETSFRTGDLGLFRPDGNLLYLGRKDSQVKIRGHRVETAEVESVLCKFPGVRAAVVTLRDNARGRPALLAFVVPEDKPPNLDDLRAFVGAQLPSFMLPSVYGTIPSAPLNANGKVDYRALPEPVWSRPRERPYVAPRDSSEEIIAEIWEQALSVQPVGIADNFFDLGGDSLSASCIVFELENRFRRRIPMELIVRAPTIEQMAAWIRVENESRPDSPVVPLRREGARPPLFVVPGDEGRASDLLPFSMLVPHLDPAQPVLGLSVRQAQNAIAPAESIATISGRLVKHVRGIQPCGPYMLAGICIGGLVAFEMARQLLAGGEEIGLLALFDTHAYGYRFDAFTASDDWAGARRSQSRLRSIYFTSKLVAPEVLRFPALKLGEVLPFLARAPSKAAGVYRKHRAEQNDRYLYQWYRSALRCYRTMTTKANVVLFVNETWHNQNPRLGWDGVRLGGLDVQVLPGTHDTYLRDHPSIVARHLQGRLDAASGPLGDENQTAVAAFSNFTSPSPSARL